MYLLKSSLYSTAPVRAKIAVCTNNTISACDGAAYSILQLMKFTGRVIRRPHITHSPYNKLSGYIDNTDIVPTPTYRKDVKYAYRYADCLVIK
jgi:hypothetical protein